MLFDTIAALMPRARGVLRCRADVGGSATYDDIQAHFAGHPGTSIPRNRIGGTLTSVRAVRRRIGPDNNFRLLELDDRIRIYRIEPALLEGLQRAFALTDARPALLRQDLAGVGRPRLDGGDQPGPYAVACEERSPLGGLLHGASAERSSPWAEGEARGHRPLRSHVLMNGQLPRTVPGPPRLRG
ncbi:hypothetical protein [Streptomyces sp. MAI_2237]